MKKLFLSFLLFFISHFAWTQVSAGPIVALNFSNVKGGLNDATNKLKIGFRAGAYLKFQISDVVSLQPEALYSTRGYKENGTFKDSSGTTTSTTVTHGFSYIDFPFLLNFTIAENGFMQIGPQIGYIINDKRKGTILTSSNSTSQTQAQAVDTSDVYGYNTTEYALSIGGGYKFKFGLSASIRFTYGLTKLYVGEFTSHNILFGISVGYTLGGKEEQGSERVYKRL